MPVGISFLSIGSSAVKACSLKFSNRNFDLQKFLIVRHIQSESSKQLLQILLLADSAGLINDLMIQTWQANYTLGSTCRANSR